MMKTAFAYHRYSTEMQRDSYTLEAQRSITKKLAEKHEIKIIQVYEDEAVSGATIEKRPSMLQLLEDLPKLKPDYLIATDQDRLSRGNDFWLLKNELAKSKTSIITEKEGIIDQSDITKDALSDMINIFSKLERRMIGRRVSRGKLQKLENGEYEGGDVIGYIRKDRKLIVDPIHSKNVKLIFSLFYEGMTVSGLLKYLYKAGIRTPRGSVYCIRTVTRLLQNPIYIGMIRTNGKVVKGKHKPIIDKKIFDKVNKKITIARRVNPTRPSKFLLTGYIKCGVCGRGMKGNIDYGSKMVREKLRRYRGGYFCYGIVYKACKNKITARIDDYVMNEIKEKIKKFKIDFEDGFSEYLKEFKMDKENFKKEIAEIDTKMSRLLDSYLAKIIDIETYRKRNSELKFEKEQILRRQKQKDDTDLQSDIYEFIKNFDIDNILNIDYEAKRNLIDIFIGKIEIKPAKYQGCRNYKDRVVIHWN